MRPLRLPSRRIEVDRVHLSAVSRQVMGPHEGLAAGGTGEGADARMEAQVSRQVAGR